MLTRMILGFYAMNVTDTQEIHSVMAIQELKKVTGVANSSQRYGLMGMASQLKVLQNQEMFLQIQKRITNGGDNGRLI